MTLPEKLNPFPSFALSPNMFYWCHQIRDVTVRMLSKSPSLGFRSLHLGILDSAAEGCTPFPLVTLERGSRTFRALPELQQPCQWLVMGLTDPDPNANTWTDILAWPWTCLITMNLSDDHQLNLATIPGLALLVSLKYCTMESSLARKLPCQMYYRVCLTAAP